MLMHPSSLPGGYSVGSFGKWAYKFIDFLADSGFSIWQVLPFCMPDEYGSPYKSCGAYSINPWFIDLETLCDKGLLTNEELVSARESTPYLAEYGRLSERLSLLRRAAERFCDKEAAERFVSASPELTYTAEYLAREDGSLFFHKFLIYEFYNQWQVVKTYANQRGVYIVGDMPMYVSEESADVRYRGENFKLDALGFPKRVAGVPPDYFAKDGQLWGNPLYDFSAMRKSGYDFFKRRIERELSLFDGVRIDHFRALDAYFSIPVGGEPRDGKWVKGPGRDLIRKLRPITDGRLVIAEDLGDITDSVHDLVRYSRYPGMRVLQFGFTGGGDGDHLPHNYPENCFAYTGTHDNNTLLGFIWELEPDKRARLFDYFGITHGDFDLACHDIIRALLASHARAVIMPVQDLLGFGCDTRMNTPGVTGGNWRFRITEDNLTALAENSGKYRNLNNLYGR